ncbi:MAG: hypothetical protein RLZZ301_427 [Bacteroidota bacterium]|jgi:gliding motility-associated-like protein
MIEKDDIKELFSKGLSEHQSAVNPALWSAVSASIGSSASTGLSLFAKWVIGSSAALVVSSLVYFSLTLQETPKKETHRTAPATRPAEIKSTSSATKLPLSPSDQAVKIPSNTVTQLENTPILPQQAAPSLVFEAQQQTTIAQIGRMPQLSSPVAPIATPATLQNTSAPAHQSISSLQSEQVLAVQNQTQINLPNIFTPNLDGQNDVLSIDWNSAEITDFSIVVLNHQNQVIFKSSDPNFNWNGIDLSGEKTASGTYIYFVTGLLNGQKWQQSSSLQIVH